MGYQPDKLPLLSRGWVLAYCHVRYVLQQENLYFVLVPRLSIAIIAFALVQLTV